MTILDPWGDLTPAVVSCSVAECSNTATASSSLAGALRGGWTCNFHNERVRQRCVADGCREFEVTRRSHVTPGWRCWRHKNTPDEGDAR